MASTTSLNRDRIENAIEALVALLDEIDGDPNMEDNGDYEPDQSEWDCGNSNNNICAAPIGLLNPVPT